MKKEQVSICSSRLNILWDHLLMIRHTKFSYTLLDFNNIMLPIESQIDSTFLSCYYQKVQYITDDNSTPHNSLHCCNWDNLVHEYRDRVYIRKDILLKLYENGELNQSKLMSYCGLNNVKHKKILDDMLKKGIITRTAEAWGNKTIIKYKVSEKGRQILREILEPYEALFPRSELELWIQLDDLTSGNKVTTTFFIM